MVAAAIATEANRVSQEQQAQHGSDAAAFTTGAYSSYADQNSPVDTKPTRQGGYAAPDALNQANPYPATSQGAYAYPDPAVASSSNPTYGNTNGTSAAVNAFAAEQGYVPAASVTDGMQADSHVGANITSEHQQQQDFNVYQSAAQSQQQQHLSSAQQSQAAATANAANVAMYGLSAGNPAQSSQNEWLRWAHGTFPHTQGQDYLSGANTLMTLRGTDGTTASAVTGSESRQTQQGQWPMMLFDMGTAGSTGATANNGMAGPGAGSEA